MNRLSCIIVEDEPLAKETLAGYISQLPSVELKETFGNALEAGAYLQGNSVDLLFLDINLPALSGLKFLETLVYRPMVIFTTAYPEHAVEGFDADAIDYLLKPFSFERFLKAVHKATERYEMLQERNQKAFTRAEVFATAREPGGYIMLKADKRLHRVNLSEISYMEAIGDYIKVHLPDKNLVVHETVKSIMDQLPDEHFIRIHKSYIIPLHRIAFLEGNQVKIGKEYIPVGAVYKEMLIDRLKRKG